jgi:Tfp pilus assembly pilus retraction ATPase PilT
MAVDVAQLLSFTVKNNASDLHLSGGVPPMIRVRLLIKMSTAWSTTS